MKHVKKLTACVIAGAANATAPLVLLAAPAFAATGAAHAMRCGGGVHCDECACR